MQELRMRAADLFERGVIPAEVARRVGVSHQIVSDWRAAWRRSGRDGLRGAGRAGRLPKVRRDQVEQVERELIEGAEPFRIADRKSAAEALAIVRDGVITRPVRVFAPGFGAGAVGGYAVMRIDPAIVADEVVLDTLDTDRSEATASGGSTSDDIRAAFGE